MKQPKIYYVSGREKDRLPRVNMLAWGKVDARKYFYDLYPNAEITYVELLWDFNKNNLKKGHAKLINRDNG